MTLVVVVAVVVALAAGSVAAISSSSGPYRRLVGHGYVDLALPVVEASNATGRALATLLGAVPAPATTRLLLQQGLDQAVADSAREASQAAAIVPPGPAGSVPERFASVFEQRAAAVSAIRAAVDGLLGMAPLLVAGAPGSGGPSVPSTILPTGTASSQLAAAGTQIAQSDAAYAAVARAIRTMPGGGRLPASAWVPAGAGATAPLGAAVLGSTADALVAAPGLAAVHRTIVSALGVSPPAAGGGSGAMGQGCRATAPPPTPSSAAVLPPTTGVTVAVTVTNCGNVVETGVSVTASVAPPGGGGRAVTAEAPVGVVEAGGSVAVTVPRLAVSHGSQVVLTVAVTTSSTPSAASVAGASWTVPLQIAS